eukprot:scaffold4001_cov67-Attheya_sp.AAC.1
MKHNKPSKYFDFHSWSEYCAQSGSIVEQSSTLTEGKKAPVEKIICDRQCCCCEGKKGREQYSNAGWGKRKCKDCNKMCYGDKNGLCIVKKYRIIREWQSKPEVLCCNNHPPVKAVLVEKECSLCLWTSLGTSPRNAMMECKKCDWRCCRTCYGPVLRKLRHWDEQLEATPVSNLYFIIPGDDELLLGPLPDKASRKGSGIGDCLLEIRSDFRKIEKEIKRLEDKAPYCAPGNNCCSAECCGVLEHRVYAKCFHELFEKQRPLAIAGGEEEWPSWAAPMNVWLRGYPR